MAEVSEIQSTRNDLEEEEYSTSDSKLVYISDDVKETTRLIQEFFNWSGLNGTSQTLTTEMLTKYGCDLTSFQKRDSSDNNFLEHSHDQLLELFDQQNHSEFFETWRKINTNVEADGMTHILEFYLRVYFASAPLRNGNQEEHGNAMLSFREYLDSCPHEIGDTKELFPFYALPYIPNPKEHEVLSEIFLEEWAQNLRKKLLNWLKSNSFTSPALLNIIKNKPNTAEITSKYSRTDNLKSTSVMAESNRQNRVLNMKLQRVQDDYHRLLGVAMELSAALEKCGRGFDVNLESTLTACTHRYPLLFNQAFADFKGPPGFILHETIQRSRNESQQKFSINPLNFARVNYTLVTGSDQAAVLLLQALRHRITRAADEESRQAVVISYIRNDVCGILHESNNNVDPDNSPWTRLKKSLHRSEPNILAQSAARFVCSLACFPQGRAYIAKSYSVIDCIIKVILQKLGDKTTQELCISTTQKLSVRGDVQKILIEHDCVLWAAHVLEKERGSIPVNTEECCAALLFNLLLNSKARKDAILNGSYLLTLVTNLLVQRSTAILSYLTGAFYSLISEPAIKAEARLLDTEETLSNYLENSDDSEYSRQIRNLIDYLKKDRRLSPPSTPPDSPSHLNEVPIVLEEELDMNDPVKARPEELAGERLLQSAYTSGNENDILDDSYAPVTRSAPAMGHNEFSSSSLPWSSSTRPHSEAATGVDPRSFTRPTYKVEHTPKFEESKAWRSAESNHGTMIQTNYDDQRVHLENRNGNVDKESEIVDPSDSASTTVNEGNSRPRTSIIRRGVTTNQSQKKSPVRSRDAEDSLKSKTNHRKLQKSTSEQNLNDSSKKKLGGVLKDFRSHARSKIDNRTPVQFRSNDSTNGKANSVFPRSNNNKIALRKSGSNLDRSYRGKSSSSGNLSESCRSLTRKNTFSVMELSQQIESMKVSEMVSNDFNQNSRRNLTTAGINSVRHIDTSESSICSQVIPKIEDRSVSMESDQPLRMNDYVSVFGAKPKVARTPPDSATSFRQTPPSSGHPEHYDSERKVLPPISRTNRSYSAEQI